MTTSTSGTHAIRLPTASAVLTHNHLLHCALDSVRAAASQGASEGIPTPELDDVERLLALLLCSSRDAATALSAREFWALGAVPVGAPAADAQRSAA